MVMTSVFFWTSKHAVLNFCLLVTLSTCMNWTTSMTFACKLGRHYNTCCIVIFYTRMRHFNTISILQQSSKYMELNQFIIIQYRKLLLRTLEHMNNLEIELNINRFRIANSLKRINKNNELFWNRVLKSSWLDATHVSKCFTSISRIYWMGINDKISIETQKKMEKISIEFLNFFLSKYLWRAR